MSIGKMMRDRQVVSCSGDQSAVDAIKLMKEKNVGCVLVTEGQKPAGIVTDRDVTLRFWGEDEQARKNLKAKDLMTKPVHTISEDAGVHELVKAFSESKSRRVLVTNNAGASVGILSTDDVLPLLADEISELSKALAPSKTKLAG